MPRPHGRPIKGRYPFRPIPGMTHTPLPGEKSHVVTDDKKPTKKGLGCRLSAYGDLILDATAGMNPPARDLDTHQIEEVMRTQHPTMDHLDRPYLLDLAQAAWEVVQELRADGTYKTPTVEDPYP